MAQAHDRRDLLDILFASRNKAYGAFALRRQYQNAIRKAVFWGISGPVLALLALSKLIGTKGDKAKKSPWDELRTVMTEVKIQRKEPPKIIGEAPKPPAQAATVRFIEPSVQPDDLAEPKQTMPEASQLIEAQPSDRTQSGEPSAAPIAALRPVPSHGEGASLDQPVEASKPKAALDFVEKMPSFPGGEAALLKYLAENLRYPALARESSIEGRVVLEFIVETDGSLSSIQTVRDIGGGCSQEAIKVLKKAPRWEPGAQNGIPVRVRMKLPIYFKLT